MDIDFFISYTAADSDWAEWIAWQLEDGGYSTILQAWDFAPGSNFVFEMNRATTLAKRTIAVVSSSYLERLFTQPEWGAAFARDPTGEARTLLPIRVRDCDIRGLLSLVVFTDLVGLDEKSARKRLLEGVGGKRTKPITSPVFPGTDARSHSIPFPGKRSREVSDGPGRASRSLICAKVTASGLLDLELPSSPYRNAFDSADEETNLSIRRRIFICISLPKISQIMDPNPQNLIPVAAVCTVNPDKVLDRLEHSLPPAIDWLKTTPSDLRREFREPLIEAVAFALRDSLVAAVAVPSIALGAGRRKPEMAYRAMLDLFLSPILEMHRRIGFEDVRIWLSDVGCNVVGLAKAEAKTIFPRRRSATVESESNNLFWSPFINIARFLGWIVNSYYNSENETWLRILQEKLESHREA